MPTYEYRCLECEKRFEKFQPISEQSLSECIYCGGRVERLISGGSGLLFKGSGFYITDHRSDSYKKEAGKEKESGAKVKTASPESKPAENVKKASGDD